METKGKPTIDSARLYIKNTIEELRSSGNYRLPPHRIMAKEAGVPRAILSQVVREMVERGQLKTMGKWGTLLPEFSPKQEKKSQSQGCKWQRIFKVLQQSIFNGDFPTGSLLPSTKELCYTYSVHALTIRKALHALLNNGLVEPYKRGYRVTQRTVKREANTLLLVKRAHIDPADEFFNSFETLFVRLLQAECRKKGINLKIVLLRYVEKNIVPLKGSYGELEHELSGSSILGFIILTSAIRHADFPLVTGALDRFNLPMAIIDQHSTKTLQNCNLTGKQAMIFRLNHDIHAGEEVMRYLLSRGHTKVCYLSIYHGKDWSQHRLKGCRNVLAGENRAEQELIYLSADMEPSKNQLAESFRDPARKKLLYKELYPLQTSPEPMHRELYETILHDSQVGCAINRMVRKKMINKLIKNKIRDKSITAWICADDMIAHFLCSLLEEKGITVPRDLSIISFDDDLPAAVRNLTSYNFDVFRILNSCLAWLLQTPSLFRHNQKGIVEIPGFINERNSVKNLKK